MINVYLLLDFIDIQSDNKIFYLIEPHTYHLQTPIPLHRSRTEITANAQG